MEALREKVDTLDDRVYALGELRGTVRALLALQVAQVTALVAIGVKLWGGG